MNSAASMSFELESNRERLEYYTRLKQLKSPEKKAPAIDKWIEIYSERVQKLERQIHKLGLKTKLASSAPAAKAGKSAAASA